MRITVWNYDDRTEYVAPDGQAFGSLEEAAAYAGFDPALPLFAEGQCDYGPTAFVLGSPDA